MLKMNLHFASLSRPVQTAWHAGNIKADWSTQEWKQLSDSMTKPLKADALCYNKDSRAERYDSHIMPAS